MQGSTTVLFQSLFLKIKITKTDKQKNPLFHENNGIIRYKFYSFIYLNHSDIKYNRQEDKGGMLVFVSFF